MRQQQGLCGKLAAVPLAFLCCSLLAVGEDEGKDKGMAFAVSQDDRGTEFMRPLLVFHPRKDKHGRRPPDTVLLFVTLVSKGQVAEAAKLCVPYDRKEMFDEDIGNYEASALKNGLFPSFCNAVRKSIKSVVVSRLAIREKGGYWRVEFAYSTGDPASKVTMSMALKRRDGAWMIYEKPHWKSVAQGRDRDVSF